MKAIELKDFGGPEQLIEMDVPKPIAKRGQVVVRIYAASLNPIDPKRAAGKKREAFPVTFPFIPGGDFSGVIDSVAENVVGYEVGDPVYGDTENGGGYAEYIAVEVDKVSRKPRNISHVEAASLALVAQTAEQALDHAQLQTGQTILILGAGGAVGSVAVQLAHLRGAYVIASASANSFDRLKAYGADKLLDYKTTPFETVVKDADAVFDCVGGESQQRAYAVLKHAGILVAITQPLSQIEAGKHRVRAMFFSTQSSIGTLRGITPKIEAGEIKPFVGQTYPLSQVPQAWQNSSTRHIEGKVVFIVVPEAESSPSNLEP